MTSSITEIRKQYHTFRRQLNKFHMNQSKVICWGWLGHTSCWQKAVLLPPFSAPSRWTELGVCSARASSQLPANHGQEPRNCISPDCACEEQRLSRPGQAATSSSCPLEAGHVRAMGMVHWVESSSSYISS